MLDNPRQPESVTLLARFELAAERMARQVAEARAAAYAANLDDLRYSLRAIGGPVRRSEPVQVAERGSAGACAAGPCASSPGFPGVATR
jgi:hypothetical protein